MERTLLSYLIAASIFIPLSRAEFQINTQTTYTQTYADVAMDGAGKFVVVWRSYRHDGDSGGIFSQCFDPNREPLGNEFQINTTTSGDQTEPSVAMSVKGDFVVAWEGPGINQEDIFAQMFDPNGQPIVSEFQVNSYTNGVQLIPKIAINEAGTFVVVWESERLAAETSVISCRLYDANGLAVGEEFEVNIMSDCRYPDVAIDANGNFAVVWMQDKSNNSIIARLYDANGLARTEPFQVNTTSFGSLTQPSIAMDSAGYFIVTWDGDPEKANQDDIHARLYDPNGMPICEQFIVNTTCDGPQQEPKVDMNNNQEFVIVWNSETDSDVNKKDIFVQRFNHLGQPIGGELQLNAFTEGDQKYPAVAIGQEGKSIVVWQSDKQDGSHYGIFGQMVPKAPAADFSNDGSVDFRDFCVLAEEWRKSEYPLRTDLINDHRIDEGDLAAFCEQWLTP
jgi:hypothetical protein